MAIIVTRDTAWSGVKALYHTIPTESIMFRDGRVHCMVHSYVDAASRLAGEPPLERGEFSVPFDPREPTLAQLYYALKATPGFEGAEDDFSSIGAEIREREAKEAFDARAQELAKSHAAAQEREFLNAKRE